MVSGLSKAFQGTCLAVQWLRLHLPNWGVWVRFLCWAWSRLTFYDPIYCNLPGSSVLGDSLGKNTGVGCHALLQGIFPAQGSNPGLPHCRWILYRLSHKRYPRLLEIPKTTGVSSLSLLQGIFPTQKSNQGLLHCRWILYQLS